MALRRRTGGPDEGWHLKITVPEAAAEVRDELRLPLEAAHSDLPPPALIDLVRPIVRHVPVQPVATLRTTRAVHLMLDDDGPQAADLVDDIARVLDRSGGQVSAQFGGLEVSEQATAELIDDVVTTLHESGAVTGEFMSKAVRALGPQASAPSEVPEPTCTAESPATAAQNGLTHCYAVPGSYLVVSATATRLPRHYGRRSGAGWRQFPPSIPALSTMEPAG